MLTLLPKELELTRMSKEEPSMKFHKGANFQKWQSTARQQLVNLLKLPLESCNDDFQILSDQTANGIREIDFIFQSEPGYYVPCILQLPTTVSEPIPVVICLQGHSKGMHISLGRTKFPGDEDSIQSGDRDFANRAIQEGYAALVIEQRGMGIRGGNEKGPQCHIPTMTALLNGQTMIGQRVWDVQRSIDVIEKHFPQIDPSQIICLGNSGGGTTTFYASCIDERIKVSIPSCSICTYKDSIAAMSHCVCNFIPEIATYFDMGDLAGLIAPRRLIVVAGKDDSIFPLSGVLETNKTIQEMFLEAGFPDQYSLVIGNGGHRFYADDAWAQIKKV